MLSICFVLLLLIIIFFVIRIAKKKFYKKIDDFKKSFLEASDYLDETISSSINRFYVISLLNEEYTSHYAYFSEKKDEITKKYISDLNSKINKLDALIDERNNKEIKVLLTESYEKLKNFKNDLKVLENEIDVFLSKDVDCHNHALEYQKKYREIKDLYDENKESLSIMDETFSQIFSKIDKTFEEFDTLTESAHYSEAIDKIDSLNEVFSALLKSLKELPILCARLNFVLPKKIDELNNLYLKLEEENYPLYHLKINITIEDIKNRLELIKKQIESFAYKNSSIYLDELDEKVEELLSLLQHEIESKTYFDSYNESIYEKSSSVEKMYLKLKRIMPEYKKIYDIKESYIDLMDFIQKEIAFLGKIRREFDNYIHTSSMQPYSILRKKLCELDEKNTFIDEKLNEVNRYLKSLKVDSDNAYGLLDKTYISLKQLEYKISEMNVNSFKDSLENDFKQAYTSLDNIGMLIKITPINVEALNLSAQKVIDLENKIKETVEKSISVMNDAESSILYANRYRKDFFDVRQALISSEDNFFKGKFDESFDIAVSAIKQVKKM